MWNRTSADHRYVCVWIHGKNVVVQWLYMYIKEHMELMTPTMMEHLLQCLSWYIRLGQADAPRLFAVLSRLDTVRNVLSITVSSQSKPVRLLALRALTSICSNIHTIRLVQGQPWAYCSTFKKKLTGPFEISFYYMFAKRTFEPRPLFPYFALKNCFFFNILLKESTI